MKAKIKSGAGLVFVAGTHLDNLKDTLIINLNDRWTYKSFKQIRNHLIINTRHGEIDLVFTGDVPLLYFDHEEKDQIVFNIKKAP